MKKNTLVLGLILIISCLASAKSDDVGHAGVKVFPEVFPAMSAQKVKQKAPCKIVNDDKLNGKTMYAATVVDNFQPRLVKFQHEKVSDFETVMNVKEDGNQPDRYSMIGGQWYNGKYLAHVVFNYDFGMVGLHGFASVDLSTGECTMLKTNDSNNSEYKTFYYMDAMACSPNTNKLLGLSHYFKDYVPEETVRSHIGEVDPATGGYINVQPMKDYYFCIEYDNDGQLWAARWEYNSESIRTGACLVKLDPENGYEEISKVNLTMNGKNFMMYFNNSMRFDPSTDELFMLACEFEDGAEMYTQHMAKIDTTTGEMTSLGTTSHDRIAVGLYIPGFKGSTRGSASFVTELTSSFDNNGIVTLSWKNPTVTWNRNELTELAEVLVCRDNIDNVVATLADGVAVGGNMTWTDSDAPAGLHTYYIIPCRVKGEKGVANSWNAFSGQDVPGKPENVRITKEGNSVKLTWDMPASGAQDGWYDKASLKYNIKRYPDEVFVKENLTETSFIDDNLGTMQEYYYDIVPITADGSGVAATSDRMVAGQAFSIPFVTDMQTDAERSQWIVVDANGDGYKFKKSDWDPYMGLSISTSAGNNDDYAISPSIKLEAGKIYKTMWTVHIYDCVVPDWSPDNHNDFRFTAGQGFAAEAQNIEMLKKENYQTFSYNTNNDFEAFFSPEADGEYNFGFNVVTKNSEDNICLRHFSIVEVFDNDMSALSVNGTLNPSKGFTSNYDVTVKNEGSKDVNGSYKVQIVRVDGDNNVVIGETENTDGLKSQASKVVKVAVTPDVEGAFLMAAIVVLKGDQDEGNNATEPMSVTASPEGVPPLEFVVDGDNNTLDTRIPISFLKNYSHMESVYLSSELQGVTKIHRLALTYDTYTPVDAFDVKLYLAMTDKTGYDPKAATTYTPVANMTKVYEGKQSIVEGNGRLMIFDFIEPFIYDDSKNLIVTFQKEGLSPENEFPGAFHLYNYDYELTEYRTLRFEDNYIQDAMDGSGSSMPILPVLKLAIETATGIEDIVVGGGISFNGGTIDMNGVDAVEIAVFDIAGRNVISKKLAAGENNVNANLKAGIYVVKVTGRDGKVYTQKIRSMR